MASEVIPQIDLQGRVREETKARESSSWSEGSDLESSSELIDTKNDSRTSFLSQCRTGGYAERKKQHQENRVGGL